MELRPEQSHLILNRLIQTRRIRPQQVEKAQRDLISDLPRSWR